MRLIPLAALATLAALALAGCTVVVPPSPGTGPAPGTGVPPGAGTGVPPGPGAGTGTPGVILPPSAGGGSGGSGGAGGIGPDAPAADRPGTGMPPAAGTDSCGASGLQHLLGRSITASGDLSARGPVRILRPGDTMTMDYAPRRINVLLDAQDRIREITCG